MPSPMSSASDENAKGELVGSMFAGMLDTSTVGGGDKITAGKTGGAHLSVRD